MTDFIPAGSGGGKGSKGGGGAVEAPNTLKSRQYARVIDAICEGEIEGLVNGARSIYLNETPLINADGTSNFSYAKWSAVNGTQDQASIPGFEGSATTVGVNTEVVVGPGIVGPSITNTEADRIRVTIEVPQLTEQDTTNGNVNGASVALRIDLQYNIGGSASGFQTVVNDTISGKNVSPYLKDYGISLPKPSGVTSWDIRVVRVSPDPGNSSLQNKFKFRSYTIISDTKYRYPNTALVALELNAADSTSIPARAYHCRLLRIKVPVNYDPIARTYTGIWNGSFKVAWTNNPAWCWYDLVTNKRYGLGKKIKAAAVDKWSLYEIGKYCDELVPDGFGGYEPRMTLNVYLQSREEALKVISDLAATFRGMVYWSGSAMMAVQDSPRDATKLFTPANVLDGEFNYSGTDLQNRHTVVLVTWNDPSDFSRPKVEYVDDPDGIARYGINKLEVTSLGCTSRGQAHRVGLWTLYSEINETEINTFRTGLEGALLRPGHIIKVQDPGKAGLRLGGRVREGSTASVILIDSPTTGENAVTLTAGRSYELSCVRIPNNYTVVTDLPPSSGGGGVVQTGTDGIFYQDTPEGWTLYKTVETRALPAIGVTQTGVTSISVSAPFSFAPAAQSVWVLSDTSISGVVPRLFRTMSVVESGRNIFEVSALEHNPSKYAAVELGLKLEVKPTSVLNFGYQQPVTGLSVSEYSYTGDGAVKTRMTISWVAAEKASRYRVSYRPLNGNYITLPDEYHTSVDIIEVFPGTYEISVSAVSLFGTASQAVTATYNVLGYTNAPENITGLQLEAPDTGTTFTGRAVKIKWNPILPPKATSYSVQVLTGTPLSTKRTVNNIIEPRFSYSFEDAMMDGGPYRSLTLEVRAVNANGQSVASAVLAVSNPAPAAPSGLLLQALPTAIKVSHTPTAVDFAGTLIWGSTVSGFTPDNSNLLYDGPDSNWIIPNLKGGIPFYVRVASYDVFGKIFSDLNISTEVAEIPIAPLSGIPVVSTLGAGTEGQTVFLTTTEKLYRYLPRKGGNLITAPSDLGSWAGSAPVTVNSAPAVDGSITADTLSDGDTTVFSDRYIDVLCSGGRSYTFSMDINKGSDASYVSQITLSFSPPSGDVQYAIQISPYSGQFYTRTDYAATTKPHKIWVDDMGSHWRFNVNFNARDNKFRAIIYPATAPGLGDNITVPSTTGSITVSNVSVYEEGWATWVDGSDVLAKSVTAGQISVTSLAAISANMGTISAGMLDIYNDGGSGYGYVRSAGKWWQDNQNGWILARHGDGTSFFEAKGGSSQIRLSSWGDSAISFPNFSIDNAGNLYARGDIEARSLKVDSANIISTLHVQGQAIIVPRAVIINGERFLGTLYHANGNQYIFNLAELGIDVGWNEGGAAYAGSVLLNCSVSFAENTDDIWWEVARLELVRDGGVVYSQRLSPGNYFNYTTYYLTPTYDAGGSATYSQSYFTTGQYFKPHTFSYLDSPGPGYHVYTLRAYYYQGNYATDRYTSLYCFNTVITAFGSKKG